MWILRNFKFIQQFSTKWKHILLSVMALFIFIYVFNSKSQHKNIEFSPQMQYYIGVMNGYLVNSSKCHLPSIHPTHPEIAQYVKKYEFKTCSKLPLLSSVVKGNNGNFYVVINATVAKNYQNFTCCWAPIFRPKTTEPLIKDWDSTINEGNCTDFKVKVSLPSELEIVMVSCRANKQSNEDKDKILYKNIHAIVNPAKIVNQQNTSKWMNKVSDYNHQKMSVLILGIDSVSKLNFLRSLPETEKYMRDTGWFNFNAYNKIGDNTYPNLMAILTGKNESTADASCNPKEAYGLDRCPFLWYSYKKAGYITAYGEDWLSSATFNLLKVGFVNSPTDYYLRPYVIATEKLLESKNKIGSIMSCTGPESAIDRIFNYASNFAKTFYNTPYFGFFWTNSISHDDLNGISSMDNYFLNYFKNFENQGIFNNTMVIFLSDHGMRFGEFRKTFVGWYEDRLPFIYFRLPQKYLKDSEIFKALKTNEHRLVSPYDLYETLRDVLIRSGGETSSSSGCPTCQTLFQPVSEERSCQNAGVSPHWCTCAITKPTNEIVDKTIANKSVQTFLIYINNIIMQYRDQNGKQLCAPLELKKIHYMNQIIEMNDSKLEKKQYSFQVEVSPGGGIFEFVIYANRNNNFTLHPEEINRINTYANDSKCLHNNNKKYCYCFE